MAEESIKIYTRTGDAGSTGLLGSKRVNKESLRIAAVGDVDELNCQLGIIHSLSSDGQVMDLLTEVQNLLFELGAELAKPDSSRLLPSHATRLEQFIDQLQEALPPLRNFLLPGGCPTAAQCHLARAVCRRAERSLFQLSRSEHVNAVSLQFINRLSDLLFVLARSINQREGTADVLWKSEL